MFSVGLLYSVRDFLILNSATGMTVIEFEKYFIKYKYSNSENILSISFKCGWIKLSQFGKIELTDRGQDISKKTYEEALLIQLEDMILNLNPTWASLLAKGRTEAKLFLPSEVVQCFGECGMWGEINDELVKFWDKLSLAYRNYANQRNIETGRLGEKLSFEFEKKRTGKDPIWQSVESNLSGFDILSILEAGTKEKIKIEVKTTTNNLNYAKFHISKNEWNTACESINYVFHLWHISKEPKLYIIQMEDIKKHIPINQGNGEWESVELSYSAVLNVQ